MELLLGWLVDPRTTAGLAAAISTFFAEARSFWLQNVTFATELFKQFIGDLEQYLQDDPPSLAKSTATLTCFLAVLTPVIAGLPPHFDAESIVAKFLQVLLKGQNIYRDSAWNKLGILSFSFQVIFFSF